MTMLVGIHVGIQGGIHVEDRSIAQSLNRLIRAKPQPTRERLPTLF